MFKKLSYDDMNNEIEKYPVKTLELIAVQINDEPHFDQRQEILENILYNRVVKLNKEFKWTDENKQKLLNVNDKFMQVFESAYNEAVSISAELENRIKNGDKFLHDYYIEIELIPYLDENNSIGLILSEPPSGFLRIEYCFNHSSYGKMLKEKPIYMDKSTNNNIEYFGDTFVNNYICYQIHELLDSHIWSFYDIVNIKEITANLEVINKHYLKIDT